jgi:hypothetical protein
MIYDIFAALKVGDICLFLNPCRLISAFAIKTYWKMY